MQNLLNTLNQFVQLFNTNLYVNISDEFFFNFNTGEILICLEETEDGEIFREKLIEKYQPKTTASIFVWQFLHEIGHSKTYKIAMEHKDYNPALRQMVKLFEDEIETQAKIYFNLIEECMATEWAINWLENNADLMNEYLDKFEEACELDNT